MRVLIFFVASCIATACGSNQTATPTVQKEAPATAGPVAQSPETPHPLLGNWVGYLGENRLNVQLHSISGKSVKGRSVAAGNYREVDGTIEETAEGYRLQLKEPGTDKYDGTFDITIKKAGMVCEGKWVPFDKTLQAKPFTLSQKEFFYKPNAGPFSDASERLLTEEDVANYIKPDLRLMRNSIYARHGYSFKMKDMRREFDKQDWYMPMSTDVRNELTEIEKKNEVLIKRYEKYAAEFYDSYGR
jgi:hypothetical protein